ncbi:hypothetical protein NDU88_001007 [Pleurodeles waltl]|uniref:Complement C2 n=1 Tax=Pleurodeles waltl TaxID=8319 RepID=A0AAV7Q1V5_PLEWA|nr:hypothetical protein NDU88_001007 [Pleurodeles waltl]
MWFPFALLMWALLTARAQVDHAESATSTVRCAEPDDIRNGTILLSDGLNVGSVLWYSCEQDYYPFPVFSRTCESNGEWTKMITRRAYCREIVCPKPIIFEYGYFFPRPKSYRINTTLTFECYDGYSLRGSVERTCMANGKWSGTTAICDNRAGHCPNPGIPIGGMKMGDRYQIDEKVSYTCSRGLDLVGSSERVCLESGEWTGTEPSCEAKYSFDLPEDVKAQFISSATNVRDLLNPFKKKKENLGRKVVIQKNGTLNIYILVDASRSVPKETFLQFKKAVIFFVRAFSSFELNAHFGIISYASGVKKVVEISNDHSDKDAEIMEEIDNNMNYEDHEGKSGTNIPLALKTVYEMMVLQKQRVESKKAISWDDIRHVVLLLTDGKSNMGGRPKDFINKITEFLKIEPSRKDYLDVYAIGIGQDVDLTELSDIASKKADEKHVFKLKSAEDLKNSFDEMLSVKEIGDMCGLSSTSDSGDKRLNYPWHVTIQNLATKCSGSLVTNQWVLTSAHCFINSKGSHLETSGAKLSAGDGDNTSRKIADYFLHPCFDVTRLKADNLEDYDYDIALVKLNYPYTFTETIRPICIPCTHSTNRALKMPPAKTSCKEHKDKLLSNNEMTVKFITLNNAIQNFTLMLDNKRDSCTNGILHWGTFTKDDIQKLMRPRYLCTEGDKGYSTCKGESGGAVYITKTFRNYQLGAISWGVYDACKYGQKERPPPRNNLVPRDFHISLFEVQPWLKHHLKDDLPFLDDVVASEECPEH